MTETKTMPNDDLISRAAIISEIERVRASTKTLDGIDFLWMIETFPPVDAAPVAHGRWEPCGDDDIVCSQCGARYFKKRLMYAYYTGPGSDPMDGFWHCPHCGALLDGGEPTCGPDYCEIGGENG